MACDVSGDNFYVASGGKVPAKLNGLLLKYVSQICTYTAYVRSLFDSDFNLAVW